MKNSTSCQLKFIYSENMPSLAISIEEKTVFKKQNISIKQTNSDDFGYTFEVKISKELAGELVNIAAPFLQNLAISLEKHNDNEKSRLKELKSIRSENQKLNMLGLKALKIARTHNILISDVANKLSVENNVSPQQIIHTSEHLQRIRTQRLISFRERCIYRLYKQKIKKADIAKQFRISVWQINKIINKQIDLLPA